MISSKIFALGLLFACPLSLARVQIDTHIELDFPADGYTRSVREEVRLNENEAIIIFDQDNMVIDARVLSELKDKVIVQYRVYLEDTEGKFELVASPVVNAVYGTRAIVQLAERNETSKCEENIFRIEMVARKVE